MLQLRSTIAAVLAVISAVCLAAVAHAADSVFEFESTTVSPPRAGQAYRDATASGGSALVLSTNSTASRTVTIPASTRVVVIAKGRQCQGAPKMTVAIDGKAVFSSAVQATTWTTYAAPVTVAAGRHVISVSYTNDVVTFYCDRRLLLDNVTLIAATSVPSPAVTGCAQRPAVPAVTDEFNGPAGSTPNSQLWKPFLGAGGSNGQLQAYTNSPKNASLDGNGNLVISTIKEPVPVPGYGTFDYSSAMLTTNGGLDLCFGTVSARIKFPAGQGIWPAFWMLGSDCATVGWPQCGEVDIMELVNTGSFSGSTLHGAGGYSLPVFSPFDVATDWHEFAVDWRRDAITTSIDGRVLATWTPASLPAGGAWTFNDKPMYLILNTAVGGPGGPPDASIVFPARMLVDWVRYTPVTDAA